MADLLDTLRSNGVNDLLPADLADRLSQLGIDNVTTSTNGDVTVIRGTVRPLTDRGLPQLGTLPIEAPGINGGLRAQLAVRRNGSGQVTQWAVDLDLDRLAIAVPGAEAGAGGARTGAGHQARGRAVAARRPDRRSGGCCGSRRPEGRRRRSP